MSTPRHPRRGAWLQAARKLVQVLAVLFIVYASLSMYWRNYKVAHNQARLVGLLKGEFWGQMYQWNEDALSVFGAPEVVSDGFLGGPWAAQVAGIPLTDPWSVTAVALGGHVPPMPMILGALLPLFIAILLGKVFCSWLCPARLLFEMTGAVRLGLLRLGVPLPSLLLPRMGGYVAVAGLAFAAVGGASIFHLLLPYLTVSSTIHSLILGGVLGSVGAYLGLLVAFELLFAPGQICRSLCPTGALLEQVGRASVLKVVRTKDGCPQSCDLCRRACPYGLFPARGAHDPGCDTCGRCTPVCPDGKLQHLVQLPRRRRPAEPAPVAAPSASAAALIGLAVLMAATLLPTDASAHHNKGLPHYGYFENYPQVPTEEFIRYEGRWEFGATLFNFQGLKRETSDTPNDVRIFAYVYDLKEDVAYEGKLELAVELDGELIESFGRLAPDEETVYRARLTLPESGIYHVTFTVDVDGESVKLMLPVKADLAADQINWLLIGGMLGVLGVLFGLALAGRKKRHTPRAAAT
jgi:ferredoxin-type protein NapH